MLSYPLYDHLGSTVGESDGVTAAITNQVKYYPFGKERADSAIGALTTDKAYTGQQKEPQSAIGAYFYHARFYSTVLGRFLSADPTMGDGLNRYSYVRNNPIRYTDPSGLITDSEYELKQHNAALRQLAAAGLYTPQQVAYVRAVARQHSPPAVPPPCSGPCIRACDAACNAPRPVDWVAVCQSTPEECPEGEIPPLGMGTTMVFTPQQAAYMAAVALAAGCAAHCDEAGQLIYEGGKAIAGAAEKAFNNVFSKKRDIKQAEDAARRAGLPIEKRDDFHDNIEAKKQEVGRDLTWEELEEVARETADE